MAPKRYFFVPIIFDVDQLRRKNIFRVKNQEYKKMLNSDAVKNSISFLTTYLLIEEFTNVSSALSDL